MPDTHDATLPPLTPPSGTGKLRPDVKAEWLDALRSGTYTQATGYLHPVAAPDGSGQVGFCCLGVLCDLAVKHGVVAAGDAVHESDDDDPCVPYGGSTTLPPFEVAGWAYTAPQDLVHRELWTVPYDSEYHAGPSSLATLNDDEHLTFAQIADLIEAYL